MFPTGFQVMLRQGMKSSRKHRATDPMKAVLRSAERSTELPGGGDCNGQIALMISITIPSPSRGIKDIASCIRPDVDYQRVL